MNAFIDLMRLSLPKGRMINVPDHYLQHCYAEHRYKKNLKAPIAITQKLYVKPNGIILKLNDFKMQNYKF